MSSLVQRLALTVQQRLELLEKVREIYADLHADLGAMPEPGARCDRSGRCCRFAEFGHRLYLTTPELIYLLDGVELANLTVPTDRCPFLSTDATGQPRCGHHAQRAIGCRIFFCGVADPAPFNEIYERHHARMRALCEQYHLPYRYDEILSAIRAAQHATAHFEEKNGTEYHGTV